jgi:hypothetical protein
MTEYTTSPQAVQVYRSSRERTEHWVRSHSPYHSQFHSPESPPSVVGDIEFEERDSDDGSSHSLPPKMMLKYGDGRDIPISHWHYDNGGPYKGSSHASSSRPHPHGHPHHPHDRSWSAGDAYPTSTRAPRYPEYTGYNHPSARDAHRAVPEDLEPEEIRILPSDPHATPYDARNEKYRPRRTSEPYRREPVHSAPHKEVLETPLPSYVPNHAHAHAHTHALAPPPVTYSHSQPIPQQYEQHHPAHSHSRHRPPPSIVYAPGSHHNPDHYAPPTIVYAPTKAPGMTYTVSAPTGSGFPQYPRITAAPYPAVHSHLSSIHEEPRYGSRAPSRENTTRAPSPISEVDSGSTYYVIPTPGQKVKVLVSHQQSAYPSFPHASFC